MSIPGAASPLFIGAAAADVAAHQIDRSLRFDLAASSKLTRTPSSASNRKTWTMSYWIKRSKLDEEQMVFSAAENSSNRVHFYFPNENQIAVYSHAFYYTTNHLARDPSAWMHLVFACDTTQATDTNRFKIYKNGVLIDSFQNQSHPSQNLDTTVNGAYLHQFSGRGYNTNDHFGGYLAEVHFVDGSQLAASDFGQYDDNNVWQPKAYSASHGTNGFYLKFANNGSNAGLGTDSSGNSNTWAVNNLTAREEKWSDYLTSTASFTANQGPDKAFDNSLSGPDVPYNDSGVPMTWTPPGGLAYSSKVEIYVGGISGFTYSLNGATAVSATTNAWNTVATGSGTINTLVFDRSSGETHGPHAIRVDNVVLVDGTASNTDSVIDTPTNYTADSGNNGGNYCVLNPLDRQSTNGTLSNGNLDIKQTTTQWAFYRSTMFVSSGKYYWECTLGNNQYSTVGICTDEWSMASHSNAWANENISMYGYYPYDGKTYNGSEPGDSYATADTSAAGSVIGVALDMDNGTLTFYKDGTSLGTAYTGLTGKNVSPTHWLYNQSNADSYNFGQRPFAYTPPTGHVSLCTQNLADPTIADGSTVFDAKLYTGNASTQNISLNFGPDLLWLKSRSAGKLHALCDSVRGDGKLLYSSSTLAEQDIGASVVDLDSSGFNLGYNSGFTAVSHNHNSDSLVAWAWDAGTSTASNTDGSITSSVRASQTNGFSIVSFTGDGSGTDTIGHGLNATPELIILKDRDNATDWLVYTQQIDGSWDYLYLNKTDSKSNSSYSAATSSVFSYGTDAADYIAYCFTPVNQFSQFGVYTGNGSADGPFVYTGFKPRWLLIKLSSGTSDWRLFDTARDTFNAADLLLFPSSAEAEATEDNYKTDILSNGFKMRNTHTGLNANGSTYVYAAFAEHPFKTSRAR